MRRRQPCGLVGRTVREFLVHQKEPVHATAILAHQERRDAALQGAKPIANLQSDLQRMQEAGKIQNAGRNRWRLCGRPEAARPLLLRQHPTPRLVS